MTLMKSAILAALATSLGLCACQMIARDYDFRVVVVNLSRTEITENQIIDSTDEYNYGCGILVPSGYAAINGPMSSAPNDIFTVRWKDPARRQHEQKLDLRERMKSNFSGEIVFIYGTDGQFTVEVFDQQRAYPMPPLPKP
jgi:hypothetical protein